MKYDLGIFWVFFHSIAVLNQKIIFKCLHTLHIVIDYSITYISKHISEWPSILGNLTSEESSLTAARKTSPAIRQCVK